MADPKPKINHWLIKHSYLFPILAFTIPLAVRIIPELLMGPNVVGFDTMGYYVPGTIELMRKGITPWIFISDSPFIYLLTLAVAVPGGSVVLLMKILSPILLGALGFVVYLYARKAMQWTPHMSLLTTVFTTLYFVALRISWDMLRNEFGLIFLFAALIYLQKKQPSISDNVLLTVFLGLAVFSHQLVSVLMFAILFATIIRHFLDKKIGEIKRVIVCALPAVLLFVFIVFVNYFVYSLPATGFSVHYFSGFPIENASHLELVGDTLGFLAFCYLPMLPLLVFAKKAKSNIQLKAWIVWLLIPLLLAIVSPVPFFAGGVLPYRWTLLLVYPLSFYAVQGFTQIKWRWYKTASITILAVLSICLVALPSGFSLQYFSYYPSYIPNSLVQNTLPLRDCQDTYDALSWAQSNLPQNATLITHQVFYGYAALKVDFNRIYLYGYDEPYAVARNLSSAHNQIYMVWWVNGSGWYGQQNVSSTFEVVHQEGHIAIYHYNP